MTAPASDAQGWRRKAWVTRRAKYGESGHAGSYARRCSQCVGSKALLDLAIRLHVEGVLSEGQVARAAGLHRIDVRKLADAAAQVQP